MSWNSELPEESEWKMYRDDEHFHDPFKLRGMSDKQLHRYVDQIWTALHNGDQKFTARDMEIMFEFLKTSIDKYGYPGDRERDLENRLMNVERSHRAAETRLTVAYKDLEKARARAKLWKTAAKKWFRPRLRIPKPFRRLFHNFIENQESVKQYQVNGGHHIHIDIEGLDKQIRNKSSFIEHLKRQLAADRANHLGSGG